MSTFDKRQPSRRLVTGVTTTILTVIALANQTAYADTNTTEPTTKANDTTQTTAPTNLQGSNVSLQSKPASAQDALPITSTANQPQSVAVSAATVAPSATSEADHSAASSSVQKSDAPKLDSSHTPTENSPSSQPASQPATSDQQSAQKSDKPAAQPDTAQQATAKPAAFSRAQVARADESIDTWMPNKLLQQEVLRQLRSQNPGHTWSSAAAITKEDMLLLKTYYGSNTYIDGKTDYSLEGLQYATNVTRLSLNNGLNSSIYYFGDVADITPLASLTKLTSLDIQYNRISDVSPLKSLVNLESLAATVNCISDFSSLKDLPKLTQLGFAHQVIVNLTPIKISRKNPNYHLESPLTFKDGTKVPLMVSQAIGKPITFSPNNNPMFSYSWFFNGAKSTVSDGNGGLIFTGLQDQPGQWWPGEQNGQFNGTTVVPVKDFYYMVGSYSENNANYFAYVQAYELTDEAEPVTVRYQDDQGNTLAKDVVLNGMIGDSYQAPEKAFKNYRLKSTDGNATGTFSDKPQTVTFIYTRADAGSVTLKYQDENGKQLAPDKVVSGDGQLGSDFDFSAKAIDNYRTPANLTGTYTLDPQVLTFVYSRKDAGDVTIQYQDDKGHKLADNVILSGQGQLGLDIPDKQLTIPGYTYKEIQSRAIGTFTDQPQTMTYVYTRTAGKTVTVKYQDENGKTLHDDVIFNGYEGDPYQSEQLAIPGYTFKQVNGNATGLFTDKPQTVTYVYTRAAGKTVTVKYQDENGKTLHDDILFNGYEGDTYTSQQLTIKGYTFKKIQGNATGTFTNKPQTVTYVYTRTTGKAVTVKYQDENGKTLHDDILLNGNEGDAYTSQQLAIEGYTFKAVQGNTQGTFTDAPQTVTYVYTKNAPVDPIITGTVTVHYVTNDGKVLKTLTLTGNIGTNYQANALKFKGYQLAETPANATGQYTKANQEVTFVYKAVPTTDGGDGDHVIDPDKPVKPTKPTQPDQVTTGEPDSVKPGSSKPINVEQAMDKVQPAQAQIVDEKSTGDLPQTDEKASPLSWIWLGVVSLLTAFGLAKKRQH